MYLLELFILSMIPDDIKAKIDGGEYTFIDKVMNGGSFYNGITASQQVNETWSSPPEIQSGDCQI